VRIIGNVKGRKNWAYKLARKAESGEPGMSYQKITAYDVIDAGILSEDEIEDHAVNCRTMFSVSFTLQSLVTMKETRLE